MIPVRARRILAVGLIVTGLASLGLGAPDADAAGQPTSSWWSRVVTTSPTDEAPADLPFPAPTTPGTIPGGATAPDGHLVVEGTPEGATAITAIRWELDDDESSPSLDLAVAAGSTVNPQSIILACRAAAPWSPAEAAPGTWKTKPLVERDRCVNGIIADDVGSVSFGLQPLVSGNVLDVVLVPGRIPEAAPPPGVPAPPLDVDGSTFRWTFPPPESGDLEVTDRGFDEGSGNQFVPPTTAAPPDDGNAAEAADPPATSPRAAPSFSPGGADGPTPAPVAPDLDPTELAPSRPQIAQPVSNRPASDGANRALGAVLLALGAAAAFWAHSTSRAGDDGEIGLGRFRTTLAGAAAGDGTGPVHPPAPSTGSGEPAVGGLSRFARVRTSPPTPLA